MENENGNKPDFAYISKSLGLGLIPIKDNSASINPASITDITRDGIDWVIHLYGGREHRMTERDMFALQETLEAREIEGQENMKTNYLNQLRAQKFAGETFQKELSAVQGVQGMLIDPGGNAGGVPPKQWAGGKRRRG